MSKLLVILALLFSFGASAHCGGCGTGGSEDHSHSEEKQDEKKDKKMSEDDESDDESNDDDE